MGVFTGSLVIPGVAVGVFTGSLVIPGVTVGVFTGSLVIPGVTVGVFEGQGHLVLWSALREVLYMRRVLKCAFAYGGIVVLR